MLPDGRALRAGTLGRKFQWAPTLGGECYKAQSHEWSAPPQAAFQWAPTLGGECYVLGELARLAFDPTEVSMGTHPWG